MQSKERDPRIKPLQRPQHYHVEVDFFDREDPQTKNYLYMTKYELIGADVDRVVAYAALLATPRGQSHVRQVIQCADADHVKGMTAEQYSGPELQ